MSEHFLYIMPADPLFVPQPDAVEEGIAIVRAALPASPVTMELSTRLNIYCPGEGWEPGACPVCGVRVPDDWWFARADATYAQGVAGMAAPLPCCGAVASINDLVSADPSGVARCALAIREQEDGRRWRDWVAYDRFVAETAAVVAAAWGCVVRRVRMHI